MKGLELPHGGLVLRSFFVLGVALAAFFAGQRFAAYQGSRDPAFHDMRVLSPDALCAMIAPEDAAVVELARRLGTIEEAYLFVRDQLAYDADLPAAPHAETLAKGEAGCVSKATLLASLYRALGMQSSQVRVVTGQVMYEDGPMDHAWLEVEHLGDCLQQDATTLLGRFAFDEFKDTAFTRTYIGRELFTFSDRDFAVVSKLNRFRGVANPHMPTAPKP
jgi:transglutaminase-like putative cysteine protease